MNLRSRMAVWMGKGLVTATRMAGRGGTTLPGAVARKVAPDLLRTLAAQPREGVVAVTGTNGKTTTAKMLSSICEAAGWGVAHNRAGANLIAGLTTALIQAADWKGRIDQSVGLLEIDEATMPRACQEVRPKVAVVTNFFRDQLDRFGELEHTVDLVARGLAHLAPGGRAVLNVDDPNCARLGTRPGAEPLYYGLEVEGAGSGSASQAADARHCVQCGHPYEYAALYYAHLGQYRCPNCGHRRPKPQVYIDRLWDVDARGSSFRLVSSKAPARCGSRFRAFTDYTTRRRRRPARWRSDFRCRPSGRGSRPPPASSAGWRGSPSTTGRSSWPWSRTPPASTR